MQNKAKTLQKFIYRSRGKIDWKSRGINLIDFLDMGGGGYSFLSGKQHYDYKTKKLTLSTLRGKFNEVDPNLKFSFLRIKSNFVFLNFVGEK